MSLQMYCSFAGFSRALYQWSLGFSECVRKACASLRTICSFYVLASRSDRINLKTLDIIERKMKHFMKQQRGPPKVFLISHFRCQYEGSIIDVITYIWVELIMK